jgi:hypothetical protein
MSTHEVGISDFIWAKNRQMANFIFKMAKIGDFLGFSSRQISTKKPRKI